MEVNAASCRAHFAAGNLEGFVYAVVESGGRQYKAIEGQAITVEQLPYQSGEEIELDRVLLIADGNDVQVGRPVVEGAKIKATVLGEEKGPKIRIFKMHPRKRYRRRQGHRQAYTRLMVDEIVKG
jgi:large subunit ribosomal protein L21